MAALKSPVGFEIVYFLISLQIPLLYYILYCILVRFVLRQLQRQSPVFFINSSVL